MKIPVNNPTAPTKPGKYFHKGGLTGFVDLITVVEYPEGVYYGVTLSRYLGVVEYRGRAVAALSGYFSEEIEFE